MRRWSLLPVSVVAHVAIALALLIMPLAAEIELPSPAPLSGRLAMIEARVIPPPPSVRTPSSSPAANISAAPREIPTTIEEEREPPRGGGDPTIPGVPGGVTSGAPGGLLDVGVTPLSSEPPPPPKVVDPPRPIRPGGGIRHPAKIVHVDPVYPAIARSAGVQGLVILEAVISTTGAVENVKVLRSAPLLDRAAIDAVRAWRYTPTRLNGVPVPVLITITINFTLHR